ncbi:hypothetical protein GTA08_BOTSDO01989 [Botryosphaeria dothidea]|uniref:Uncharacterized protein n=1 Tax=Botryosphaeria dothidea TaxID=55169 RepID=A0A8H4N3E2_9PEZI|nr:hypothetical protein GTA08_BOTSDO01989 [Botryosphaeria dothidea]
MASSVSISLVKYTFTDTPERPFKWHNEMGAGLTLTFSQPYLKVTLGKKTLNSFDMQKQVQETEETIRAMASSGIVPSNEALPISALVRPGQLALGMKYAKSSRTVRRMQFKFHSQDDLTIAQDLVERAGVRIYTSWGNNSRSTRRPFSNGRASSSTHKAHTDDSENYIVEQVRNATHSDGSRTLRSYAAQTQEMRDNLLNELFIECIEDDGFIALCQDVAANWRRIGLGLQ